MSRVSNAPALSLTLLILCHAPCAGAKDTIRFQEDFRQPPGGRWQQIKFHDPTEYRIVNVDSKPCLMGFSQGGCSALATKVDLAPRAGIVCSWSWKIDHCPKGASDDKLATFDHAARVFIAFDTWIGPPRTINYVWANQAPTNATFDHPYSSRARFIVVENGNGQAGHWLAERRDVQKDWNLLFKGQPMPKIVAIGVFSESHYTRVPVSGWYDHILLQNDARE